MGTRTALRKKLYPFLEITEETVQDQNQKALKSFAPEIVNIEIKGQWISLHTRDQHLDMKAGDYLVRDPNMKRPLAVYSMYEFEEKFREIGKDK